MASLGRIKCITRASGVGVELALAWADAFPERTGTKTDVQFILHATEAW